MFTGFEVKGALLRL